MKPLLFSFQGRISRSSFWTGIGILLATNALAAIISSVATGVSQVPDSDGTSHVGSAVAIGLTLVWVAVGILNTWAGLSLTVKRYHDRDKSGWWVLIQLIPIVGAIWAFVETGCLAGTSGANRFGPDPLALPRSDVAFA